MKDKISFNLSKCHCKIVMTAFLTCISSHHSSWYHLACSLPDDVSTALSYHLSVKRDQFSFQQVIFFPPSLPLSRYFLVYSAGHTVQSSHYHELSDWIKSFSRIEYIFIYYSKHLFLLLHPSFLWTNTLGKEKLSLLRYFFERTHQAKKTDLC